MDNVSLLEARIAPLLQSQPRVLVAVDGMAASGKTTLAGALARRFARSAVVHMDDFTLPLDRRYPGYFEDALSNADVGRFDREVLAPLRAGLGARYRPYACHPEPGFLAPLTVAADAHLVIVEGAYCLHPQLAGRYDLRVLYTVSPRTQRARILRRNGPEQLARFLSLWIPMENAHIRAHGLHASCDLILSGEAAR